MSFLNIWVIVLTDVDFLSVLSECCCGAASTIVSLIELHLKHAEWTFISSDGLNGSYLLDGCNTNLLGGIPDCKYQRRQTTCFLPYYIFAVNSADNHEIRSSAGGAFELRRFLDA